MALQAQNACLSMQEALIYYQAGRMDEAVSAIKRSLKINPVDPATLCLLGDICRAQGLCEDAVLLFNAALRIKPADEIFHNKLGNVYSDLGQHEKAATCFKQALHIRPDFLDAHYNLGNAFKASHQLDLAESAYRNAIRIKPDLAPAHHNLGLVLKEQKRYEDAAGALKEAVRIQPDLAQAHYNLAGLYRDLGRLAESKGACERAIAIKPDLAEAHHFLVKLKRYTRNDDHLLTLENLIHDPGTEDRQKIYLHFALGKIYEDLEEFDKAFIHIHEGNRVKRKTYTYEIEEEIRFFSDLKKVFTTGFVDKWKGSGTKDAAPIFVLGMPRSGTSLVEQILSSHPAVYGAGEVDDLAQIVLNYCRDAKGQFPGQVVRFNSEDYKTLGKRYMKKIRRYATKNRIVDKMPQNFIYVGMIKLILPNARIIHCQRAPMDTCWSLFKTLFTAPHLYAYDLLELGAYYRLYQDLMDHWQQLFPGEILKIGYETLIEKQKEETARLLEYCNLKWDDACLAFHKTERPVATASAVQVRRPIYKDSIHLWKRYQHYIEDLQNEIMT